MLSKSFEQYKFNEFVNKAIVDLKFDNPKKIVFCPVSPKCYTLMFPV